MAVGCRSLSNAWIVGTSLCVGGTGGHLAYSSSNQTGSEWLLSSGYIFNPPKFTSHENRDYGCAENLLKDNSYFDDSKEYACRVAGLSIWNNGEQFKDHNLTVDYLTFSSEYVIRLGSQAWKEFRRIDNKGKDILHDRWFTIFSKQNGKWEKEELYASGTLIPKNHDPSNPATAIDKARRIASNNEILHFSFYDDEWFSQALSVPSKKSSNDGKSETLSQVWKKRKSGAWVWIESGDQSSKDATMYSKSKTTIYGEKIEERFLSKPWTNAQRAGKWTNAEEFCKFGNEKNLNENQKKNLQMFCARPKI